MSTEDHVIGQGKVAIVADDLTGACDAAVAFARRRMQTEVRLDWRVAKTTEAQVMAVTTDSRDIPVAEVEERLQSVAKGLKAGNFEHIFKKIDSVFRGNTVAEITAATKVFRADLVIVAPAYPALGRISRDGLLLVRDVAGESSIAVREMLRASGMTPYPISSGCPAEEVAEEMRKAVRGWQDVVYCDATTEAELQQIVLAGREMGVHVLWVGSGGLAHALARQLSTRIAEPVPLAGGAVIFFVGSDHPVTQRQLAFFREEVRLAQTEDAAPSVSSSREPATAVISVEHGRTTEEDIRGAVQGLGLGDVSCMFMTGGYTAALVCRALRIDALQLFDEFEPGLPLGIAIGGELAGTTVILKSGGFGETDVLCRIANRFVKKEAVN